MYKISDEVINFVEKVMKTWREELTPGGSEGPERYIQGGCTINITICNSDDATQPNTQEMQRRIQT